MAASPTVIGPRSLADALRQADDDTLRRLFVLRPDLIHPVPADLGQLAIRATTGPSVSRALDRLDAFVLQVAQIIAALPDPTTFADVRDALPEVPEAAIREAVMHLSERMLLWGVDEALHLVRVARESFGLYPCGLGTSYATSRRSVASYAKKPASLTKALKEAPAEAQAAVERLVWGPPIGTVAGADRIVTIETARSPIEWLLAREILVASDRDTVMLPREVALILRNGVMLRDITPHQPILVGPERDVALLERTAGGNAFTFIRLVEGLLNAWTLAPAAVLKSGGVSVRDLARTAISLNVDEGATALVIEVALAAGLIGIDGDAEDTWIPTTASDIWISKPEAQKWLILANAWLDLPRAPMLVGTDVNGKKANALSTDVERAQAPEIRRAVLGIVGDAAAGTCPTVESILDVLAWRRPRRASVQRDELARASLREAELVGLTGLGALSSFARLVLDGTDATSAISAKLPALVDHVVVQADLTVIAPGPLTSEAARLMSLLADVESSGAATVYRVSDRSLRRALDAGMSSMEVLDTFTELSKTEIPQPLRYLIDDVARKHGSIRVGVASSYIRSDDESVIATLLADKKFAALRLMKLAPTVVASSATPDVVLEKLRDAGLSPMAESSDGVVMIRRPDTRRAPSKRRQESEVVDYSAPSEKLLTGAVRALRAGDSARTHRPDENGVIPRSTPSETLELLRSALEDQARVWIGYADPQGGASERVVEPLSVDGGFLTAYDTRSAEVKTFTIARITGVAALAQETQA